MTIFNKVFWADAAERALKTVAQSILSLWVVGDKVFSLLSVDWKQTLSVAAGAGVISLLTSIISAKVTSSDSASLSVKTVAKG